MIFTIFSEMTLFEHSIKLSKLIFCNTEDQEYWGEGGGGSKGYSVFHELVVL